MRLMVSEEVLISTLQSRSTRRGRETTEEATIQTTAWLPKLPNPSPRHRWPEGLCMQNAFHPYSKCQREKGSGVQSPQQVVGLTHCSVPPALLTHTGQRLQCPSPRGSAQKWALGEMSHPSLRKCSSCNNEHGIYPLIAPLSLTFLMWKMGMISGHGTDTLGGPS